MALAGASVAGGAIIFAILAVIVRNPDGTIITRNPNIVRENQLRNRRWAGGVGFGILLSLGLILGVTRGSFLLVGVGAFTGFLFGLLGMVVYAQLITRPQR